MSNDILNAVQEYMINGHVSDAPFIINDYVITLERLDNGVRISATRGGQTESVVVYDGDLTNLDHEVLANRSANDQHPINAISGLQSELDSKQPVISDLEQIRTNAGKGATAVQHNELSDVATSGSYNDLNGKPNLARVATTGSYNDLVDKPSMVLDHNNLTGRSGYNQHPMSSITGLIDNLNSKQGVISDLSEIRSSARKADTAVQPSDLATVATTGSYNDLTDKPTVFGNEVEVGPTPEDADLWIDTNGSDTYVDPSVRWDVQQNLTDAQKEQARNNIGAVVTSSTIENALGYTPADAEDVNEIKGDLTQLENVTSALISASDIVSRDLWPGEFLNGYYDAQGNFVTTNNYQDCKPVDVSKYNQLTITFVPNINQVVVVGFFDNDNVGAFTQLDVATSGTNYSKTLAVPTGAKSFVVTSRRTSSGSYDSWEIIGIIKNPMTDFADNLNALDERITSNESDLARIKSDVYTTTEDFVDIPLSFTNTGWYGENGVYHNSADYQYAEVLVNKGEVYDVTGRTNWGISPYIVLDSNNNMLYTGASGGSGTTVTRSERITIPNGGVRLCFSASKNDTNWKNACKCVKVVDVPKSIVGTNYNALKGIKWGAIGDSFTDPVTLSAQTDKRNYVDLIREQTGVNAVNLGVSGTGYKRTEESNTAFYQRANNVDTDFDVITIFGSGNDQQYSAQTLVGNPTDTGTSTLAGCVNTTIDNLIARNPVVRIGIVAPTPWAGYAPFNTGATWMKRYTEMLKGVCELRGIPFLDLYHQSNLRPWDSANMSALYKDDTHPNTEGHKRIASKIKAFLIEIAG